MGKRDPLETVGQVSQEGRDRRISLLHLRGVPCARIAEFVGQRDLTVTANTYTHVISDETNSTTRGWSPRFPVDLGAPTGSDGRIW